MSHTRVKTTYMEAVGPGYGEERTLYCHHNHSCDITTFYEQDGEVAYMVFEDENYGGRTKWDAVMLLDNPHVSRWGGELKPGVEHCGKELNELFDKKKAERIKNQS